MHCLTDLVVVNAITSDFILSRDGGVGAERAEGSGTDDIFIVQDQPKRPRLTSDCGYADSLLNMADALS